MLTGIKFTIGILVIMAILMCIGAFAISSNGTSCPDSVGRWRFGGRNRLGLCGVFIF